MDNIHIDALKVLTDEIHWLIEKMQGLERELEEEKKNKHVIHYPAEHSHILQKRNDVLLIEINELENKIELIGKKLDNSYLENEKLSKKISELTDFINGLLSDSGIHYYVSQHDIIRIKKFKDENAKI